MTKRSREEMQVIKNEIEKMLNENPTLKAADIAHKFNLTKQYEYQLLAKAKKSSGLPTRSRKIAHTSAQPKFEEDDLSFRGFLDKLKDVVEHGERVLEAQQEKAKNLFL